MRIRMCTRMHRYQPGRHKGVARVLFHHLRWSRQDLEFIGYGIPGDFRHTGERLYSRDDQRFDLGNAIRALGRLPGFGRKINNKQTKNSDEVTLGSVDPCRRQTGSKLWWHCTAGGCSRDRGIGVDDGLLCPWDRLPSHELTGFEAVCSARTSSW